MAKMTLTDAYVLINAVDLSTYIRSVTINYSAEIHDATGMGGSGTRERLAGLKDWSVELEFFQDYAAAKVDATLFPLVGTSFSITLKPTSGAVSATNPSYSGTAFLESYSPIAGQIGDPNMTRCTLPGSGTLTRAVA